MVVYNHNICYNDIAKYIKGKAMSDYCCICGNLHCILSCSVDIKDGKICGICASICSSYKQKTMFDIIEYWEVNERRKNIFKPTKELTAVGSDVIEIDYKNKLFSLKNRHKPIYYSFTEVKSYDFEFLEKSLKYKKITSKEDVKLYKYFMGITVHFKTYAGKCENYFINPSITFIDFLDNCIKNNKKELL